MSIAQESVITLLPAETPFDCAKDEHKAKWLRSLGLADDKRVIDCDISAQTVTFNSSCGPFTRQVVECWTRVMGYHRPVASFNTGKQGEFNERLNFCTTKTEAQLRKEA